MKYFSPELYSYNIVIFHAEKGDNLLTKKTVLQNPQKLYTNVCVRKIISKQNIVLGKFSSII